MTEQRILVIDDEPYNLESLDLVLSEEGFQVDMADGAQQGLDLLSAHRYNLVLLDLRMPGKDGFHTLPEIKEHYPDIPVIILSAFGQENTARVVRELGAYDYIGKPPDMDELLLKIENGLRLNQQQQKLAQLRRQREGAFYLESETTGVRDLFGKAAKAADLNIPVLITGESGTGKEVMARFIHARSSRASEPFMALNCSALPAHLIESELFGYEQGAFSGAAKTHAGLFLAASKTTLLLDEIGDMPLDTQAKILRVIETGEFLRLGSTRTLRTGARIIAATHRNLAEMVQSGTFREDLYYRLTVFTLAMPPLRERPKDIPALCRFFLSDFCTKNNLPGRHFSPGALRLLQQRELKGNIRQLKNLCIKAAILSEGDVITEKDVQSLLAQTPAGSPLGRLLRLDSLKEFKRAAERLYLVHKLKENDYNISQTAEQIGTPRSNLYKKLNEYDIATGR